MIGFAFSRTAATVVSRSRTSAIVTSIAASWPRHTLPFPWLEMKRAIWTRDSAPICVLQPRITRLAQLWDIAAIHRRRLQVAHRYALIPNLTCVAGAFIWGFTSLASVVMTNLGTYCVYSRTTASIRGLEHQIAKSLKARQ